MGPGAGLGCPAEPDNGIATSRQKQGRYQTLNAKAYIPHGYLGNRANCLHNCG